MTNEQIISSIRAGGNKKELMAELWKQNEGLIKKIVGRYISTSLNKDIWTEKQNELMQQAYIGFDRAVSTFDASQDFKFSTWMYAVVPREINKYLTDSSRTIRLPVNVAKDVARYKSIVNIFEKETGREPSDFEVSRLLKVDKERIAELRTITLQSFVKSLDEPITGFEDEQLTLADTVADDVDRIHDVTRAFDHEIMKEDLSQAMKCLDKSDADTLKDIYNNCETYDSVAKKQGITKVQVVTKRQRGLTRLRHCKYTDKLKKYYEVYLEPVSIRHVGVANFNRDWTSSTEWLAVKQVERQEKIAEHMRKLEKEIQETDKVINAMVEAETRKRLNRHL